MEGEGWSSPPPSRNAPDTTTTRHAAPFPPVTPAPPMFLIDAHGRSRMLLALALLLHSIVVEPPRAPTRLRSPHLVDSTHVSVSRAADADGDSRSCFSPSPAIISGALAAAFSDAAAVHAYYPSGGADATSPLRVSSRADFCLLVLVQQPLRFRAHAQRTLDMPMVLPNPGTDALPATDQTSMDEYPRPDGSVPDDLIIRLVAETAAGAPVEIAVSGAINSTLRLISSPDGVTASADAQRGGSSTVRVAVSTSTETLIPAYYEWHSTPRFTVYSGVVRGALLDNFLRAAGGAVVNAGLAVRVEHPAFSWNSNPTKTMYPCSGQGNPSCGAFDDAWPMTRARLPLYASLVLPVLPLSIDPAVVSFAPRPACNAASLNGRGGMWVPSAVPGALPRTPTGPWWRADTCDLRQFTGLEVAQCFKHRAPTVAFFGDSHMRRHFKDFVGRSNRVLNFMSSKISPFGIEKTTSPTNGAVERERDDSAAAAELRSGVDSTWCKKRFDDIDCRCSDEA